MKRINQILHALLALCMACALLTMPALAAPEPPPVSSPAAAPETPETPKDPETPSEESPQIFEVPDDIAACRTKSNGCPYYIMVNRSLNTVTVYTLDGEGYYTVPFKAMLCSTGREGHETPLGDYSVTYYRRTWNLMVDGTYGQYATQFNGNILFHSVCYSEKDPTALLTEEYNLLGSPASRGCVRLQTVDAKWIYDNCAAGTRVTVYDGTVPGALGKPEPVVACISPEQANGWDPTDPREANPWHAILAPEEPPQGEPAQDEPSQGEPSGEEPSPEEPAREELPRTEAGEILYTVQRGDTLGSIAKEFYGVVSRYMDIYRRNQDILASPDLIYTGQVLVIPNAPVPQVPAAPETTEA